MIDYKKLSAQILQSVKPLPKDEFELEDTGPAPAYAKASYGQAGMDLRLNLANHPNQYSAILRKQIETIQDTKGKKFYTTDGSTLSESRSENEEESKKQKSIRIFTTPPKPSPLDLYQRGLQFGRATLAVLEYSTPPPSQLSEENSHKFKEITDEYSKLMLTLANEMNSAHDEAEKLKIYKRAAQVTHCYLGAMAHLVNPDNPKQAHLDILKAADMLLMMEPMEDIICTYHPTVKDTNTLQFSERVNPAAHTNVSDETKGWFKYNINKHGDWFRNFVNKNWDQLKDKPAPSTARDLPHAANTWDEITVTKKSTDEHYHESHSGRIGITTPYQLKGKNNTADRINHAADASRSVLETQYDNMIQRYEDKWGSLYDPNEEITIPILHATYVAPTLFYSADRSFIDEKTQANQIIRDELDGFFQKEHGKKYKFELLEVNNCINIHRHLAFNSSRDRGDSNKLIGHSTDLLTRVANKLGDTDKANFNTAIAYLNSANTLPPRFKGPSSQEKAAIEAVIEKLNEENLAGLSAEARSDLKLLLQASVELKRVNHESIFSPARRWLNELPYVGPAFRPLTYLAALPFRFGEYILSLPLKLRDAVKTLRQDFGADSTLTFGDKVTMALSQFSSTLIGGRNKQTFKSALEEIIADKLGYSLSGCKSALDRKGEVEVVKTAMLEQFSEKTKLPDYYDVKDYNQFFVGHVMPIEDEGHQIRLAATADFVGERKMWETRPGQYVLATDERQEMAKLGAAFRGPKASKWAKFWDATSNPFRAFFPEPDAEARSSSAGYVDTRGTKEEHQSPDDLLANRSSLSFSGSSQASKNSSKGVSTVTECEGKQTLEQFQKSQSEFTKQELIEPKIERVGIGTDFDDLDHTKIKQEKRFYIFKDKIPTLTVTHDADRVRMETKRDFAKEKDQLEILALQIKMMTDQGMTATITQGPLEFRNKLVQKCTEIGVSADKVRIPDRSTPAPAVSSRYTV